jgi:hypothetical protein
VTHVAAARTDTIPWGTILRSVGVVAGSAVWVQFVGSLDMWARFDRIGIAPTPTVALLPRDLLFVAGVRALAAPLLLGTIALGALVLWPKQRPRPKGESQPTQESRSKETEGMAPVAAAAGTSPRGEQPRGLKTILIGLAVVTTLYVISRPLDGTWTAVLIVASVLASLVIYLVVVRTEGFGHVAAALFVATALFGGLVGIARQYGEPVTLDIAVALRKDGSAIGGFFIGRSSESMYLLTTAQPGGKANNVVTGETINDADLFVSGEKCVTRTIAEKEPDCYVQQVVGIRSDDVAKFSIGPRGVIVGPRGFRAARVLAQVALLRADEEVRTEAIVPPTTTTR